MKVTVAHLFKKLEELDRDAVELQKLTDRLAEDREYSPVLKETFAAELEKLEEQKKELLSLKVSPSKSKRLEEPPRSKASVPPLPETTRPERPVRKY